MGKQERPNDADKDFLAFKNEIAELARENGLFAGGPVNPFLWYEVLSPEDEKIWEKVKNKDITRDEFFAYISGQEEVLRRLYAGNDPGWDAKCRSIFLGMLHSRAIKVFDEREKREK